MLKKTRWSWFMLAGLTATVLADTPPDSKEQEAEARNVVGNAKNLNETCHSNVQVVMDWASFRTGYDQWTSTDARGRAAYKCGEVLDNIRALCSMENSTRRDHEELPVAPTAKTIRCTYAPNGTDLSASSKNGTLSVGFGWRTETGSRDAVKRIVAFAPIVVENVADPKAEQEAEGEMTRNLRILNKQCGTNIQAEIDWPSFRTGYGLLVDSSQSGPDFRQKKVAYKCSVVLESIDRVCGAGQTYDSSTSQPLQTVPVKTVRCTYAHPSRDVVGTVKDGALTVAFGWNTDVGQLDQFKKFVPVTKAVLDRPAATAEDALYGGASNRPPKKGGGDTATAAPDDAKRFTTLHCNMRMQQKIETAEFKAAYAKLAVPGFTWEDAWKDIEANCNLAGNAIDNVCQTSGGSLSPDYRTAPMVTVQSKLKRLVCAPTDSQKPQQSLQDGVWTVKFSFWADADTMYGIDQGLASAVSLAPRTLEPFQESAKDPRCTKTKDCKGGRVCQASGNGRMDSIHGPRCIVPGSPQDRNAPQAADDDDGDSAPATSSRKDTKAPKKQKKPNGAQCHSGSECEYGECHKPKGAPSSAKDTCGPYR